MVPVRFVTEALGAKVDWEAATNTAIIAKEGTTLRIQIGNKNISVAKNGTTSTVKMDTVAVNKDGRTMIPVRFVAEALGATVDWSSKYYNCAQIYDDVLSADRVKALMAYPLTEVNQQSIEPSKRDQSRIKFVQSQKFADAREYAFVNYYSYANVPMNSYLKTKYPTEADVVNTLVEAAKNPFDLLDNNGYEFEFITDSSMLYHPEVNGGLGFCKLQRGYLAITHTKELEDGDYWYCKNPAEFTILENDKIAAMKYGICGVLYNKETASEFTVPDGIYDVFATANAYYKMLESIPVGTTIYIPLDVEVGFVGYISDDMSLGWGGTVTRLGENLTSIPD